MAQSISANEGNTHQGSTKATWYLYLVENKLGQLYTGITTNPKRRIAQHRGELKGGAKALKGKAPLTFKAIFEMIDKSHASKLEYEVKRMSRPQKNGIIRKGQLNELMCMKPNLKIKTLGCVRFVVQKRVFPYPPKTPLMIMAFPMLRVNPSAATPTLCC